MRKWIVPAILAAAIVPAIPHRSFAQTQDTKAAASTPTAIAVEDQATPEQIDRLYKVMRVRQQIESSLQQMSAMMQQQMAASMKKEIDESSDGKKLTAEQQQAREQILARFLDRALHAYTADEMLSALTPIYQRHISRSDIEGVIAFYGSSAGQHLLEQQPLIMQEYMGEISKTMQDKIATVTDELKKEIGDLDAKENPDKPVQ